MMKRPLLTLLLLLSSPLSSSGEVVSLTFEESPDAPPFIVDFDLVGTKQLLPVISEYCSQNVVSSCVEFRRHVENSFFELDAVKRKELPWLLSGDVSVLIRSLVDYNTETLRRVYFGFGSYGWQNINFFWMGETKGSFRSGRYNQYAGSVTMYLGGNHCYKRAANFPFESLDISSYNSSGRFSSTVYRSDKCPYSKGPTVVGNDVWFGGDTTVMSGITIGDGAVVGAGAVVRHDVPPYAIVVGNPAQIVGYRHSPEQIEKLMAIKWWDWDMETMAKNLHLLIDMDVNKFIEEHSP